MQAPDGGDGGCRDGAEGSASGSSGPGRSGNPGLWEGGGTEGAAAGEAPQVDGALLGSGRGAEASAEGVGNQQLEFGLTVPFLSFMDAEIARRYLAPGIEALGGAVHREFTVIGSDLVIRLTAENSSLLQISVASLLNQLSMVVQAMQRFVPPYFLKPQPGKGG
uniref:EKC/KEOPS complex subunit LAGE3-like n=1 Tax=Ictidomys tridecemlineatus TaxID=43179 RepID=UPI001AA00B92|nr:EKC/KEOPS complex subunit LAGE3-like [Ictidomys tridecemlineatus]